MSAFCACRDRATSLTDSVCAAQRRRVEPHVDLALAAADHHHLADAVGALEPPAQHLVGELGDVAHRLGGGHRHGDHRRGGRVELLDRRLEGGARQLRQDAVDAITHFLGRGVAVLVEDERHHHLRDPLRRDRTQRVDGADGVDRFLDLVGDLGLDLLGRGPGQAGGHDDGRDVDVREAVDAEPEEGEQADDRQRQHQHPGEDRAPDTQRSEPLHGRLPRRDPDAVGQALDVGGRHALPGLQPVGDLDAIAVGLAGHDDAFFGAAALDHEHPRGAGQRADGGGRDQDAGRRSGLFDARGGEEARLQAGIGDWEPPLPGSAPGSRR